MIKRCSTSVSYLKNHKIVSLVLPSSSILPPSLPSVLSLPFSDCMGRRRIREHRDRGLLGLGTEDRDCAVKDFKGRKLFLLLDCNFGKTVNKSFKPETRVNHGGDFAVIFSFCLTNCLLTLPWKWQWDQSSCCLMPSLWPWGPHAPGSHHGDGEVMMGLNLTTRCLVPLDLLGCIQPCWLWHTWMTLTCQKSTEEAEEVGGHDPRLALHQQGTQGAFNQEQTKVRPSSLRFIEEWNFFLFFPRISTKKTWTKDQSREHWWITTNTLFCCIAQSPCLIYKPRTII